jgi:DNA mismatch endonuclease (patch repair protein)
MTDIMSPTERSARMALIRGKNTAPELAVRRVLHRLGYRYRLHARDLPGNPDVAFRSRRKAIFVHGCFWHQHRECPIAHVPASRQEYWVEKFKRTVERDAQNLCEIRALGWEALVVWECEVGDPVAIAEDLTRFLGGAGYGRK